MWFGEHKHSGPPRALSLTESFAATGLAPER